MTTETQDIESNSDVETLNIQSENEETESVDDISESELEESTQITFDGQELDDESEDEDNDDNVLETEEQESVDDTPLVKKLRKVTRNQQKELKIYKSELERLKNQSQNVSEDVVAPVAPQISDYLYDEEKFKEANDKYNKDMLDFNMKFINLLEKYEEQKKSLNIKNFDVFQKAIEDGLSKEKQRLLLKTEKPALIVYALAKQPHIMHELSGLSNSDFAYRIAKIENKIQVNTVKKTPKTKPEKLLTNTKTGTSDSKSTEDALYKKCAETGDFTEYFKFINSKGK